MYSIIWIYILSNCTLCVLSFAFLCTNTLWYCFVLCWIWQFDTKPRAETGNHVMVSLEKLLDFISVMVYTHRTGTWVPAYYHKAGHGCSISWLVHDLHRNNNGGLGHFSVLVQQLDSSSSSAHHNRPHQFLARDSIHPLPPATKSSLDVASVAIVLTATVVLSLAAIFPQLLHPHCSPLFVCIPYSLGLTPATQSLCSIFPFPVAGLFSLRWRWRQ